MDKNAKVFVAGSGGLVGSAVLRALRARGFGRVLAPRSADLDLTRQEPTEAFFAAEKPEYVVVAAAKVGGILANNTYPAEFIYKNLAIAANVVHAAYLHGVKRLLFLGSTCIYPKFCPQPMKEEHLLTGPLEPTNEAYAVAKIAGLKLCEFYHRQYGCDFWSVMPTNLYGELDNFNLETSHVLPAMLRKFHLAKAAKEGRDELIAADERVFGNIPQAIKDDIGVGGPAAEVKVPLWGDGTPRREFLHTDDVADACLFVLGLSGETPRLLNIGCGSDLSLREIADAVAETVGYEGQVVWDSSKPNGTPQKLLDVSRMTALGWKPRIDFTQGLSMVYRWYLNRLSQGM